ncbi:MAG: TetR family transcriptional regulator C-terminal domain-containing protein [Bacteroidia bacterium]
MTTRDKILRCIYEDMKIYGYQGLRPDKSILKLGLSKGAMYHYFRDKSEIGYLIVEELVQPEYLALFIPLLSYEGDPVNYIQHHVLSELKHQFDENTLTLGLPVFNLIQEMAPLDEGFRTRLQIILETARDILADGFRRGKENGTIVPEADPVQIALLIQSGISGAFTLGKATRDKNTFFSCLEMTGKTLEIFRNRP